MSLIFQKVIFYLTTSLFFFLPLHAWLVTWFPILVLWKELVLIIIFILGGTVLLLDKNRLLELKSNWQQHKKLITLIVLLFFVIIFKTTFFPSDFTGLILKQFIYAFRTDFLGWIVLGFFLLYTFSSSQKAVFFKATFFSSLIVLILGIIQFFVPEFFLYFGYSKNISSWTPGITSLPMYHGLGEGSSLIRLNSSFSSPNHLGAYLLIILPLIIFFINNLNNKRLKQQPAISALTQTRINKVLKFFKIIAWGYFWLFVILLLGTFSRSAWLGFLIMTVIFVLVCYRQLLFDIYQKNKIIWLGGLVTLFVVIVKGGQKLVELRPLSSSEHVEKFLAGSRLLIDHWWGLWMGGAGPVSVRFDPNFVGIITENWFLQIALEIGIIGVLLYLLIYFLIAQKLWLNFKEKNSWLSFALLLSYIGISIMACFLHIWENIPMTILFFMFVGMALNGKNK